MGKVDKKRYHLIDAFRGFAIIHMILYHFSYDVCILYGKYPGFLSDSRCFFWQQCICMSFILISGFSASFSRSHWKRGLLLNVCGLIITVVTSIASPSAVIYFGILNFLGCAILLLIFVEKWITEKNWMIVAFSCLILFVLTRNISDGYVGIGKNIFFFLPFSLYQSKILTPFGFPYPGFFSSDYFPVIPWFFLFLIGYCLHYLPQYSERIDGVLTKKIPFFGWLGKQSLVVYMIHQPVLMLICMLLF